MRSTILFFLSLPLLFSCSEQEALTTDGSNGAENIPAGMSRVSFISDSPSQCVYIFRKEGSEYRYDSMMDSGWSENGTMVTNLLIGDYKFLFANFSEGQLNVFPSSLDGTVTLDQLRFVARPDTEHEECILPVGELFLPEPNVADSVYSIQGNNEIKCTLHRRVSQLEFMLKRGYKNSNEFVDQPYGEGEGNILEKLKELHVKISGVARECNYEKVSGEGTVVQTYSAEKQGSVNEQGFVTFTGPFVFPPANDKKIVLEITAVSPSGETYQTVSLSPALEPNRKLEVNLWFTSSGHEIGITLIRKPLSGQTDGDMGVWN